MSYSDLPKFLWGYALEIAAYILNSISIKSVPDTPIELWTGHKPNLQHYRIWDVWCMYLRERQKLKTKSELCYFM